MDLKHWTQEQEQEWQALEALLDYAHGDSGNLTADELRQLGLLYRNAINDLSRVRSTPALSHLSPYLNNLVQRSHSHVYAKPPTRTGDIWRFFTTTFPQCFRRNLGYFVVATLTFFLGAALAMSIAALDVSAENYFLPPPIIAALDSGKLWFDNTQAAPSEASMLMTNNIRVAFNAYVLGITFGVGTLWVLFMNGIHAFGGPLQVTLNHGIADRLLLFMIPHGILELSTIFISGGAGLMIGAAMLFPSHRPRWDYVKARARESLILIAGCVILLVIAGLIEGLVSLNQTVPDSLRIIIALSSGLLFYSYVSFCGRYDKETSNES